MTNIINVIIVLAPYLIIAIFTIYTYKKKVNYMFLYDND